MFSFYILVSDEWSGIFFMILVFIALLYGTLIKQGTNLKLYSPQPLIFFFSLCVAYLIIESPLSILSHLLFSSHMVFMSIHYFIIPPLLLLGIPPTLYAYLNHINKMRWIRRLFISPIPALYSFSVLFFAYHFQMLLQTFSQYSVIHKIYIHLLFYLSINMWRPIVYPPANQMKPKKSFIYKSSLLLMPACLYFIVTGIWNGVGHLPLGQLTASLCLPTTDAIDILLPLHNKSDPLIAGILMLVIRKVSLMGTMKYGYKLQKDRIK